MASSYIWKPSTVGSWKGGPVFLAPQEAGRSSPPVITANGQTYTGKYINTNEGRAQWVFPKDLVGMQNLQVSFGGQTGTIQSGASSYEGGGLGNWGARAKGSIGGPGGGSAAYADGGPDFTPGTAGPYGFFPSYLGGQYPNAAQITYDPIKGAQYNLVDPQQFASTYGEFNRGEIAKNFGQAKGFALDTLNAELSALQNYIPAQAALKRGQTSADNIFNQQQREAQVNSALPSARADLNAQAARARAYASGNLPDAAENAALTLGTASQAADNATTGGFGASSSVAKKASALMSAQQRFQIGQYGEQLTGQNLNQQASLFLAPTEYSNAGSQINVNPSISPAQLIQANVQDLNNNTLISPTNALNTQVQQNQFKSNLDQQTQQFNAQLGFNTQAFNATAQNQFALGAFNYDTGYAGTVAGAYQTQANTELALAQQAMAQQAAQAAASAAQRGNGLSSILGAVGSIAGKILPGIIGGGSGSAIPGISDILGSGSILNGVPEFGSAAASALGSSAGSSILESGVPSFSIADAPLSLFSQETGVPSSSLSAFNVAKLVGSAAATVSNAGISASPQPGFVPTNISTSGQPVYMNQALRSSNSIAPAIAKVDTLQNFIEPLGADIPTAQLTQLRQAVNNPELMQTLEGHATAQDPKGFVNAMQSAFGKQETHKTAANEAGVVDGVDTALSSYGLFQNWNQMSTAQKALGVASVGIQGLRTSDGKPMGQAPIPATNVDGAKPLNVSAALQLANQGYNMPQVVTNWGDISNLQRITAGSGTVEQAVQTGQQAGLVSQIAGTALSISPSNALNASLNLPTTVKAIAAGWGHSGGTAGVVAGSQAATQLGMANTMLGAALGPIAFAGLATGGHKSGDQKARDWYRGNLIEKGLINEDYQLTLPDGSQVNLGDDGHAGTHKARNPDLITDSESQGNFKAYQTDYTNPMDYASGMAGTTLARMLYGGRTHQLDQMGSQLGNAFLGKVGYGKDMSPENFNTVMTNARGVYSQAGIKSQADAMSLLKAAQAQGRITGADYIASKNVIDMMYKPDGYHSASKVVNNRMLGIRGMSGAPLRTPTVATGAPGNESLPEARGKITPTVYDTSAITRFGNEALSKASTAYKKPTIGLTKEDVRQRNKAKYAQDFGVDENTIDQAAETADMQSQMAA